MQALFMVVMFVLAQGLASGAAVPRPAGVEEELALANAAYERYENKIALEHYLNVLKEDPKNYEALWKGARSYADVGKPFEKDDQDKALSYYQAGDSLARQAVSLYPDSANTHFVLALCVGRVALFEGGKTKIRLSKEVKKEADLAVELDPRHDGAYHILGRWNYNIATLGWFLRAAAKVIYGGVPPGATLENAAAMFEKAIEIAPEKPVHRLEYGRTLIELGRKDEARKQLEKCIELPQVQWDDPAHKKEAETLLKKL